MKVDYPKELRDATWQRNKGIFKALTEATGVGKHLKAAEDAYDEINWDLLDFKIKEVRTSTVAAATKAYTVQFGALETLLQAVAAAQAAAQKAADKWGKEKTTPKSATQAAKDVADTAKTYTSTLRAAIGRAASAHDDLVNELASEKQRITKTYGGLSRAYVEAATLVAHGKWEAWGLVSSKAYLCAKRSVDSLPSHPTTAKLKASLQSFQDEMMKGMPNKIDETWVNSIKPKVIAAAKVRSEEAKRIGDDILK